MSNVDTSLLKNIQHLPLPELIRRTPVKDALAAQCSQPEEIVKAVVEWRTSAVLWAAMLDARQAGIKTAGAIQTNWYFFERYRVNHGSLFEATTHVNDMLKDADIANDMPCSAMMIPFDDIYLRVANSPGNALYHHTFDTGDAYLEGAYISTFNLRFHGLGDLDPYLMELGFRPMVDNPCLDIGLVWRIPDKPEDLPIVQPAILPLIDGDKKLPEALDILRNHTPAYAYDPIGHIAKILLYINSPNGLREEFNEYSELEARIQKVQGKKRPKLERKLARATNRIVIGPKSGNYEALHTGAPTIKGEKSPHWRRRHPQLVWYGEGKRKARLMIIEPTLVRKDKLGGKIPPDKSYTVK